MINNELKKRILSSIFLIPIAIYFIIQENIFFVFFLSILFLVSSYEWIKMNKKDIFKVIGIFYLFFAFYSAYLLREKLSIGIFILILVICVFSDLGGYTFGKILKGPKLTKISPKKTYAGVIGGYFCSIIFMALFLNYADYISVITNTDNLAQKLFVNNFILTILISTVSQIGDIIISYFKRKSKIKNTGKIIPGHGGLLDRIDGMIFAIPLSYFLISNNFFNFYK